MHERTHPQPPHQVQSPHHVAVFGAGYIGLVAGACFAELGHSVTVRDIRHERIDALRAGSVPLHEPGLAPLITRNKERLRFTLQADDAVRDAEIVYVCVDTPPTASGDADLSRVWAVVEALQGASHLAAVVMKSTVPVGTGARVRAALDKAGLTHVPYASNPEFTAEGQAVQDFLHPDRVVIGTDDEVVAKLLTDLHRGVDGPVEIMDVASAEMAKLTANALLATKISFTNEIAALCEATGADITKVTHATGMDHRLGPHFMRAGLGYGGSCFPKDSRALRALASNSGYSFQLLSSVIDVNDLQPRRAVKRLQQELAGLSGRTVAVLGMTFKPGTDDMREAPSTVIASRLLAEGARVRCWDPLAPRCHDGPWASAERCADVHEALRDADAALIVTEWPHLRDTDWRRHGEVMREAVVFDGRNLLDPEEMREIGYTYLSVGRPTVRP